MNRACPHCGQEIHVFDEECASCGRPSKPGLLKATASIVHGHRSLLLLIAALVLGWIILSTIFPM